MKSTLMKMLKVITPLVQMMVSVTNVVVTVVMFATVLVRMKSMDLMLINQISTMMVIFPNMNVREVKHLPLQ
jgi:hypothetical protein